MSHMKRYNTLCAMTGRNNLESAYHAAFYLLAYDKEVIEAASKCVSHDGIEFSKIKRSARGLDERTRFVIDIAHNLFSYYSPCKVSWVYSVAFSKKMLTFATEPFSFSSLSSRAGMED